MGSIEFDSDKIEKYYKGGYSEKEESYITEVFTDDSKVKELNGLLSKQFSDLPPDEELDGRNLDHILYKIHYDINTRLSVRKNWSPGTVIRWALNAAVAILIPLVIFMGIKNHREANNRKETWVEIKAPAWTRAQFRLPDGTVGWLNSNSSIRYNGNYFADRQVALKGEAYFNVAKDIKRPFIVNTPDINIKVLGTKFNVASYQNEKTVEVVLEEGSLLVIDNHNVKSYTMKPNDLVIFNKSRQNFSVEVVSPQKYIAWTDGKLVFRNDPPDVIARRLERWYNIDVEIKGSTSDDLRWRATFVDDNLEEVLKILKRSLHVDFKIESGSFNPDETIAKRKVMLYLKNK